MQLMNHNVTHDEFYTYVNESTEPPQLSINTLNWVFLTQ